MKRPNGLREGNVLVVVGVTSVMGIVAASTLFMTNSGRRAEKRAELKEKAYSIASSALDETILKIMNNSAGFVVPKKGEPHVKETHIPAATIMMYESVNGVQVDPVKVFARRLEAPTHDDAERNRFYGFLMLGPRFATNHNPNWRGSIRDARVSKLIALPDGVKPSEEATRELRALVPDNMIPTDRVAKELAKLTPIPAGQEGKDPQQASPAAQQLAEQLQGKPQERITKTASEVQVSCGVAAPPSGLVGAMAMVALGEESANGAKATGANAAKAKALAAANPGGLMQEPVKLNAALLASLLKSGCMDRDTFLVTLEGKASVDRAGIKVEAPLSTNRVVEQSRFDHVGTFAYGQFLAYLHVHYNLSFEDMQALGWVNKNGEVVADAVFPELIAKNNLRTNPQPWPFQISRTAMVRK